MEQEKSYPFADEAIRNHKRAYYACVRYVDRQVGKVLTALDNLGLTKDTIVVVWGDHGWHLGEQEIWAKHTPFERATRSVLMMYVPNMRTAGHVSQSLAASIDIYPTLVELCNPSFRETQYSLDGVSLVPIIQHERTRVRNYTRSYWKDAVSVRTAEHRLVARVTNGKVDHTELYDVSKNLDSMVDMSQLDPATREKLVSYLE